jgi:putative membrane protein
LLPSRGCAHAGGEGGAMDKLRATDTLASERTFLAYLRTALAFIAFGFVIARFALFLREAAVVAHLSVPHSGLSDIFGAFMAVAGGCCALYGGYRYVISARALREGKTAPLSDTAAIVGAALVAAVGSIVAFLLPALR